MIIRRLIQTNKNMYLTFVHLIKHKPKYLFKNIIKKCDIEEKATFCRIFIKTWTSLLLTESDFT